MDGQYPFILALQYQKEKERKIIYIAPFICYAYLEVLYTIDEC